MKEISAGSVIYRLYKETIQYVIIHQIHGNHFGFPKGHVEKGESIEATIKRECYEEVGVDITILGYPMYNHYIVKTSIEKEVIYMLSKTYHDTLKFQKDELYDAMFLSYEEALAKLTYQRDKDILMYYHAIIKEKL